MPTLPFAGFQTVASTGVAVPAFGTVTTAAAQPVYDQFSGNQTGANPSVTALTVSSTAGFTLGSPIVVGIAAQLGTPNPNIGRVASIGSSTSMTVNGLTQPVLSGAYVILCECAESITITPSSTNAGQLYIGKDSTTSSTSASTFAAPVLGIPWHAETTDKGHAYNTSNYWVAGTANDTYLCSYSQG